MKKELAIVMGATSNMAFALANVILGLDSNLSDKNFDIIVFNEAIEEKDKTLINSILPCKFIDYDYPSDEYNTTDFKHLRFTKITYSRYECFDLLGEYENVLWLDIDIVINRDLWPLINECSKSVGFCEVNAPVSINFNREIENYDMNRNYFNAGIMLLKDSFPNFENMKKWLYKKTNELSPYLYCPDQGILNLMFQEFNLEVYNIGAKYNCYPRDTKTKEPAIIHTYCPEKFWNFYSNSEWNKNYKKWIKMGGSPYTGKKAGIIEKFFKTKFPEAPNPFKYPKGFVKYLRK
jgi:lipopolysaccharide biosynthesis glycosyltransferase